MKHVNSRTTVQLPNKEYSALCAGDGAVLDNLIQEPLVVAGLTMEDADPLHKSLRYRTAQAPEGGMLLRLTAWRGI